MLEMIETEFKELTNIVLETVIQPLILRNFQNAKLISQKYQDTFTHFQGLIYTFTTSLYIISIENFHQIYENTRINCCISITRIDSHYTHYYEVLDEYLESHSPTQSEKIACIKRLFDKHERILNKRQKNELDWWFNPDFQRFDVEPSYTTNLTRYLKILILGEVNLPEKPEKICILEVINTPDAQENLWISIALFLPSLKNWFIFSHVYWKKEEQKIHFYLSQIQQLVKEYQIEYISLEVDSENYFPNTYVNSPKDEIPYQEKLILKILNSEIERSFLDYKKTWLKNNPKHKYELVKDVIALINGGNYHHHPSSYLICGVEEIDNKFEKIVGISNGLQIKMTIESIIREFIEPIPEIDSYLIEISKLKGLHQNSNIVHRNLQFESETDSEQRFILIIKLNANKRMVYEVKKEWSQTKNTKKFTLNKGMSWIRHGEHTNFITEKERRYITNLD